MDRLRKDQEFVVDLLQQWRTDMASWPTVRDFWAAYFERTGANLKFLPGDQRQAFLHEVTEKAS